jgi:three-Cys-motif partner protein
VPNDNFFDEATEQSAVKASIVSKYFWAWANVIMPSVRRNGGTIAYVDLFCGPGMYKDGTKSTPLLVLEKAISDPDMREMLTTVFNDKDRKSQRALQQTIDRLPGIGTLAHPPRILCEEVGGEIAKIFDDIGSVPTLFFVDPFGYKGLTLALINNTVKNWGSDCIFFFNYKRINAGLENPTVREHMDALFGQARADQLRQRLEKLPTESRELEIVEELCRAVKGTEKRFVLPFGFKDTNGTRTTHHLIFVTKAFKGYEIMKEIMAKGSSDASQGVASFAYSPADVRQPLLFKLSHPVDDLQTELLQRFAGLTCTMGEVYEQHSVDTPYIRKNYKEALGALELAGKITAEPPAKTRKKGTFADHVRVTFPKKRG